MAKKSVINRNEKRIKLVEKYRAVRDQLRDSVKNINLSPEERRKAMQALQELPRDSSPSRRRNRCKMGTRRRGRIEVCGRPRGNTRLTGLCKMHMRAATVAGMVPGMRKASW